MGPTDDVGKSAKASPLYSKYGTRIDNQSAREMLAARLVQTTSPAANGAPASTPQPQASHTEAATAVAGGAAVLGKMLRSRAGRQVEREVIRSVFGMLKKSLK